MPVLQIIISRFKWGFAFIHRVILLFNRNYSMTVMTFIMLQKISVSNKCCSSELSINL